VSDLIRAYRVAVVRAVGPGACNSFAVGAALFCSAGGRASTATMKLSDLMPSMSAFIIYIAALTDHRAAKRRTQACTELEVLIGRMPMWTGLLQRMRSGRIPAVNATARHWTKSYTDIPTEIDPDRYSSVVELLDQAMRRFAGKVAFRSLGNSLTFGEVDKLSSAFCAYLQSKLGVKKGDRIAVMAPNIAAFPIAFIGIARAGAVQVNVNPLYTARELEHQLNDAGCETIVIFNGSTPTLAEIVGRTGIRNIITAGAGDALGVTLPGPSVDPRLEQTLSFASTLEQGANLVRKPVALSGGDLLFLQYTGGTTGLSKGASLSHRNLVANTEQFKAFLPYAMRPGEEVIITAIPLYHIFALMVNFITYFSVGAENWLVANPRDMDAFIAVLKQARPTVFMGVNTLYAGLTMHPGLKEVDWSRLRLAGGGGAAVVGATSERWRAITGTFIREGYGLSETSPVLSFNPGYITQFTGTTGLPLPSTDIKLLDDEGREAPIGQPGEICAKGPQVMGGYWAKPEANAAAFTEDGYFKTGDVGVFDEQGFLKIVDRKKDMVIVSGFNVFPNEVEEVASACPGVAECACIGVPDARSGEAVKLFAVKTPHAKLSEDDVIAHCRTGLTSYKVPKIVRFVDALPKSTVGKILRRELRSLP
jgi:long-chain acyl-CoA synthetase